MTPREYLDQLRSLVIANRNEEALAFAESRGAGVFPQMTVREYQRATSMLEGPVVLLAARQQTHLSTP